MHIIAISSSFAAAVDVLLALSVEEVCDWRVNGTDLLAVEEPSIDVLESVLGVLLITVLDVDVADNVIAEVIHHDHILNLAVLAHLLEDFFEE